MTPTRPNDSATAKMISKKEGWQEVYCLGKGSGFSPYPEHVRGGRVPDPRDCTDAALELLRWAGTNYIQGFSINGQMDGRWFLDACDEDYQRFLPCSGQPFRYAVVSLAIEVMEIKE